MNNYISNLYIETYRGIKNLEISDIGSVNILVGGNNAGKTSVLEAIQLFCSPNEYDLVRISKQRDRYRAPVQISLSTLDSLLFLFNIDSKFKEKNDYVINISAIINGISGQLNVVGEIAQEMLDLSTLADRNPNIRARLRESDSPLEEEVETFIGSITHSISPNMQLSIFDSPITTNLEINKYSRVIGRLETKSLIKVEMTNTVDHLLQNTFSMLIKNKDIKDIAVTMLKKFDATIEDIRYINDENRFVPVIEVSNGNYIPLSSYGDGMKKALTLLNSILSAPNGIVLIDEFETALHTSVMKSVFRFMIETAFQMKVQLFLTTHSLEAVDKLLEASGEFLNEVRIIRLKKDEEKMFAKITVGDIALENRTEYDMELRV